MKITIGLLEVGFGQWLCTVWLVGEGPHDYRGSVLVSLNELVHHSNMVVESLVSKVFWSVCRGRGGEVEGGRWRGGGGGGGGGGGEMCMCVV